MTNGDRIRKMDNTELAALLAGYDKNVPCLCCIYNYDNGVYEGCHILDNCDKEHQELMTLKWLEKESEESEKTEENVYYINLRKSLIQLFK